eukprot:sb/3478752/
MRINVELCLCSSSRDDPNGVGNCCGNCHVLQTKISIYVQSTPIYRAPIYRKPRFTGRVNFPRYRKLTVFHPDIPGTPIYQAKSFPPEDPGKSGSDCMLD